MAAPKVRAVYWLADDGVPLSNLVLKANLFTHVFCGFAKPDPTNSYNVTLPYNFPHETEITQLKNHSVTAMLSISGGTDLDKMAANKSDRNTFIASSNHLARQHGFQGIDLYYKYPATEAAMNNLSSLLSEWRDAIQAEPLKGSMTRLLLTATVYYTSTTDAGHSYPVEMMDQKLDWINVMAYGLHNPGTESEPTVTAPAAPLNGLDKDDVVSGSAGINQWIASGVEAHKIVLGIPFWGYAWTLSDPGQNGYGVPAEGPAITPDGTVPYSQIAGYVKSDPSGKDNYGAPTPVGNYWYSGTTWISYDSEKAVHEKVKSCVKAKVLRGYFGWTFATDDDSALAAAASNSALEG